MATVDDLVRVSGYSRSTVFRFLAGKNVRPAARDAIRAASRETGFGAVSQKSRDDVAILFSAPAGFEGFRGFADAMEGIIRQAGKLGLPLFFDEDRAIGKRIAAICLGKSKDEEDAEFERRKKLGQMTIFVNRMIDDPEASWASIDFAAATKEGVARLASVGCHKIAVWANPTQRRVDQAKLAGIHAYAQEEKNSIEILEFSSADGAIEDVSRGALSSRNRPDGWFAFSDEAAMRVIHTAASLGLKVPDDISVLGMNDVESAAYFSPPLTSIRIPFRDCGTVAVDIAQRLFDNPSERSVKILLRHKLIERNSCARVGQKSDDL